MSNKTTTFNFNIRKTATNCPKGKTVMDMVDSGISPLPVKVLLNHNEKLGKIEACVDEISKENVFGFVSSEKDQIEDCLNEVAANRASYMVQITGRENSIFNAEFQFTSIALDAVEKTEEEKAGIDASLKSVTEDLVNRGVVTQDFVDEAIAVMTDNNVMPELMKMVFEQCEVCDSPHIPKAKYANPTGGKEESPLVNAIAFALKGVPMIFEGDKAVGKNVCAETIAWLLHTNLYQITFSLGMSGDDIFGTKSTDNSAAQKLSKEMAEEYMKCISNRDYDIKLAAEYEYQKAKAASIVITQEKSQIVEWMKNGGVMVFNEANLADPNFFASFTNPLTDGTGFLDVPGYGRVKMHKKCVLILTQNANYTGVCDQNEATISRFACEQFPYPKSIIKQLKAALKGNKGLSEEYFRQTDKYYQALHKAVIKGQLENTCLNIRGFVRALDMLTLVPGYSSLKKQIKLQVINTCLEDDRDNLLVQLEEIVTL